MYKEVSKYFTSIKKRKKKKLRDNYLTPGDYEDHEIHPKHDFLKLFNLNDSFVAFIDLPKYYFFLYLTMRGFLKNYSPDCSGKIMLLLKYMGRNSLYLKYYEQLNFLMKKRERKNIELFQFSPKLNNLCLNLNYCQY